MLSTEGTSNEMTTNSPLAPVYKPKSKLRLVFIFTAVINLLALVALQMHFGTYIFNGSPRIIFEFLPFLFGLIVSVVGLIAAKSRKLFGLFAVINIPHKYCLYYLENNTYGEY